MKDSTLRDQIKAIRGINAEVVLDNMNNDANGYLKVLRMLDTNHGSDIHKLIVHLVNDEIEQAQTLAHDLAGAAGMLSLTYLQKAASELEENLGTPGIDKESIILKESIRKAQKELTEVLADIASIK